MHRTFIFAVLYLPGNQIVVPQIVEFSDCCMFNHEQGLQLGDEILELVNPTMVETDGEQVGAEGCLSVPGKYGLVTRPNYAKVSAQDRDGNWFEAEGEALIARCFCHELDHLDGIVYTQVMDRFLTEEELAADDE